MTRMLDISPLIATAAIEGVSGSRDEISAFPIVANGVGNRPGEEVDFQPRLSIGYGSIRNITAYLGAVFLGADSRALGF